MSLTNCLLTGISLTHQGDMTVVDNHYAYWYAMTINGQRIPINLCQSLFDELSWESAIKKFVDENKVLLVGEFMKDDFKNFKGKMFHWNCKIEGKQNHINIKQLVEEIKEKADYPKTRKEKYDNLLKYLHKSQTFEGSEVQIGADITFYGKLYFQSFEEMQFFLRELQRKGLIDYEENTQIVQFTFYGLEYVDTLKKSSDFDINMFSKPKYQIGLSFAGEDRQYVDEVANELKDLGVSVFYDNYEQVDLWGKDLYQHLNDVYKNKCEFCIVFISEHYAKKLWTIHELKSAQTKAFNENKEYILPAKFDNTELPGVNSTVGYIDCTKVSSKELALLAARKVGHQ
jgi:hypothetical protein